MYLKTVRYLQEQVIEKQQYPFNIAALQHLEELHLPTNITFLLEKMVQANRHCWRRLPMNVASIRLEVVAIICTMCMNRTLHLESTYD